VGGLPGPDPAVMNSQGPDMFGHALEYVAVGMPISGRIFCRVYGTSVVVNTFLAEPGTTMTGPAQIGALFGLSNVEELFKLGP